MIGDLREMWRMLALSPARVAVAIAWGVAALGSGLGLAALAAWLIARAWQMPPVLDLSVAVVAVRALGISRGLCRYLERLATHDVALRAMTTARTSVYRTLAQSDVWWWRNRSLPDLPSGSGRGLRRGDVLVRIGADIDDLGAVVVRVLVPVAVAVVLSLAAVGLIATISPLAAVILAVALGVSGILAPWMSAVAAREAERAVRVDRAEFTAEGLTVLDHAAELRVAGRLDAALVVADKASQRAVIAEDSAASRSAWAAAATPLSIGVSTFGALLVGIAVYGPTGGLAGGMTPMALTILVLVPLSAFEAVGALPAAATTLTTSRAALHRLRGISVGTRGAVAADSGESERHEWGSVEAAPADVDRGAVEIRERVRSVDADEGPVATARRIPMPTGSRVVVVGPSGAGKTTLLMAWAGLFDTPRDGVTFFAEDAHLFGTSILENLRVARGDLTLDEAESAMRTVGLGPWLDSLPDGLHTSLTAGAAAVSGGQRRRILLARALVAPAHTLLLDEPTEHLSAAEGDRLLRELLDVDSGLVGPERTVVVVTHQLPVGHGADTVVTVDATGACHIEYPHTATSSAT